jgi:protein-tyrosine-phosphatase
MSEVGAVLFACNQNRVRSPMAEALMKARFPGRIFVDSCGARPEAGDGPDPFVVAVLAEIGIDSVADHAPKGFDDLEDESFDLVISLTPEAQHRAVELARGRATELEYWPTFDPTLVTGPRETVLEAYREVRDALAARIAARFPQASTLQA